MLLIQNGLLYPMDGRQPFVGDVLVDNGRIVAVGTELSAGDATVCDARGKHILPGFIDAHCHIGMCEDGMGEEGEDANECSDPVTPQMRAIDGLNPFDPCFREAREAGVTSVVTGPGSHQ